MIKISAPINVFPHYPLRHRWGYNIHRYSGRFDSKPLPHPGVFDLLLAFNKIGVKSPIGDSIFYGGGFDQSMIAPSWAFDNMVCKSPPVPEDGVVGRIH